MQEERKYTPLEIFNMKIFNGLQVLGRDKVMEIMNKHEGNETKD